MEQYISKSALIAEIERRRDEYINSLITAQVNILNDILSLIDTLEVKIEPVSNDLEEAANDYAHDLVHDDVFETFIAGAKWKKENLWKNAQGDDLPEIDREVIVLYQPYQLEGSSECAVGFAHRPPERWYGRNLDGEEHVFEPKTYDKGEWNIPNVVWWLDLDLPIKGGISYESNAR